MTNEQINIAIAEACGWTLTREERFKVLRKPGEVGTGHCCGIHLTDEECWRDALEGDENGDYRIPDYCTDLNAMREAESRLPCFPEWCGEKHYGCAVEAYMGHLANVVRGSDRFADDWQLIHASAMQRAMAFVKTIGKWEEPS